MTAARTCSLAWKVCQSLETTQTSSRLTTPSAIAYLKPTPQALSLP